MAVPVRPFDIRLQIPKDTFISKIDTCIRYIGASGTCEDAERLVSLVALRFFLQDSADFSKQIEISFDDYAYIVLPIVKKAFDTTPVGTEQ